MASTPSFSLSPKASDDLHKKSRLALSLGLVGLGVSCVGLVFAANGHGPEAARPLLGWLLGFGFWLSIALGMLLLIMLTYLFDSGWTAVVRRQLEHGVSAFKWLGVAFVPLLIVGVFINPSALWHWMDTGSLVGGGHGTVGEDILYQKKSAFLNPTAFVVFSVAFFAVTIVWAELLRKHSFAMDKDGDLRHCTVCYRLSAAGAPLVSLLLTFGAIYWFKSLEYHWFSTMYGVWYFAASIWASLAVVVILLVSLSRQGKPLAGIIRRPHIYFTSCLLFAFTVFWAYISFSQYFLIYNANIPEETFWYHIRQFSVVEGELVHNSWFWVSWVLMIGHFLFPFLFLLWHGNKFGKAVMSIAVFALLMHVLDLYWNILPSKLPSDANSLHYVVRQLDVSLWDFSALVGIGGLFLWSFLTSMRQTSLVPIRDPRIQERP